MNHNKTAFCGQSLCWKGKNKISHSWERYDVCSWNSSKFIINMCWKNNYNKSIMWDTQFNFSGILIFK